MGMLPQLIQIILLGLQAIPLAAGTVSAIKQILAKDPNIPADLQALLASTADDDTATLAALQTWVANNPA